MKHIFAFVLLFSFFSISCGDLLGPDTEIKKRVEIKYIEVYSAEDLIKLTTEETYKKYNSFSNTVITLKNDIDLENKEFKGIAAGSSSLMFCGTFDGNNKKSLY